MLSAGEQMKKVSCPFCGSRHLRFNLIKSSIEENDSVGFIRCLHCEATGPYTKTKSPEENIEYLTIAAWNGILIDESAKQICIDCNKK
jgi:transcription elongation factor Elf1